ncbi:DNA alkylation repair protein [Chloroflexota bacterium]
MKIKEAREFGARLAEDVHTGKMREAMQKLNPLLAQRIKFPVLGAIGGAVGAGPLETTNQFLPLVAATKTEGGWPIVGMALGAQLDRDLAGALVRCRAFMIEGDIWYCADILSERVPGPALLLDFDATLKTITPWRDDENRWVRRSIGVAIHYWAKRAKGAAGHLPQAVRLLDLIEPMFTEWEMDVVKGVGWSMKTLGQYFPDLLTDWLVNQVVPSERKHRALMLKKAITYLSPEQKARILKA